MIDLLKELLGGGLFGGDLLETEHALVMLLLLYGLLTYRGPRLMKWVPAAIVAGILLSVFTPIHQITLFWPIITALVVPPFLWQSAVAVTRSGPLRRNLSLAVWVVTLLLVALSLRLLSGLPFSNALLIGILAVTLVWYYRELNVERSYLSTIGLITLVLLLVEIDIALLSVRYWLGTLASGLAVGIAMGFLGLEIYRRLRRQQFKGGFFIVWAYLAYLIGLALGTSAIAVTLAAALVVAAYGFSIGLWNKPEDIPVPANTPAFFFLASGIWLILGWQAHTTPQFSILPGVLAALAVIAAAILVVGRTTLAGDGEDRLMGLVRKETGVLLLLIGSVILWPGEAFVTTISVEMALLIAAFLIVLLRFVLVPLFDLLGIELSWPTENR
jgi:hypothetical protein